jgi:hypothetical protein
MGIVGHQATVNFFQQRFGFNAKQTLALMGVHSLGNAKRRNSGFAGAWSHKREALSNRYYSHLTDFSWTQLPINQVGQVSRCAPAGRQRAARSAQAVVPARCMLAPPPPSTASTAHSVTRPSPLRPAERQRRPQGAVDAPRLPHRRVHAQQRHGALQGDPRGQGGLCARRVRQAALRLQQGAHLGRLQQVRQAGPRRLAERAQQLAPSRQGCTGSVAAQTPRPAPDCAPPRRAPRYARNNTRWINDFADVYNLMTSNCGRGNGVVYQCKTSAVSKTIKKAGMRDYAQRFTASEAFAKSVSMPWRTVQA